MAMSASRRLLRQFTAETAHGQYISGVWDIVKTISGDL